MGKEAKGQCRRQIKEWSIYIRKGLICGSNKKNRKKIKQGQEIQGEEARGNTEEGDSK